MGPIVSPIISYSLRPDLPIYFQSFEVSDWSIRCFKDMRRGQKRPSWGQEKKNPTTLPPM